MSNTIIAAYDGSGHAELAVRVAVELAKSLNLHLVLLNVKPDLKIGHIRRFFSDTEIEQYSRESGLKVLEKAQQSLQKEGISFECVVRYGVPEKEIGNYAEETSARWIVMGSRGMGAITGKILGSVSSGIIKHARCPVVIVPDAYQTRIEPK